MKLQKNGKYYILPIDDLAIAQIVYDGLIRLVFDDDEKSFLDIHSEFTVTEHRQTRSLAPNTKEALNFFYDHFGEKIRSAQADLQGNLWVIFEHGAELTIEDGPYENWHYTKINKSDPSDSLHVHGGVGALVF